MPPKKRKCFTNRTKAAQRQKLKSRERMARRREEKRALKAAEEKEVIRPAKKEKRPKRKRFEGDSWLATTIPQRNRGPAMSTPFYEELKKYIQQFNRCQGQVEIPPTLLARARARHVDSLVLATRKRLITEAEEKLNDNIFTLCPGLAPPPKRKGDKDKYQKAAVLPLSIEQEEELWWKRWLLLALNIEFDKQYLELEEEVVELEAQLAVPHKVRGQKRMESSPVDIAQTATAEAPNTNLADPLSNEWEDVTVKEEAEDDLFGYEDMTFLADDDDDEDLRRDRAEMQDWIAKTVSEVEDKAKSSKAPYQKISKKHLFKIKTDQMKAKGLKALSAKLEQIRKLWIELQPRNNKERSKVDAERKEVKAKLKQEKQSIIESMWKEFDELRAKLCQESQKERTERLLARYEHTLQLSYSTTTAQIEAAKIKAQQQQQSPQTQQQQSPQPQPHPKKLYSLRTPEEKRAFAAQQARIRTRMEKNEFLMYKSIEQALEEPSAEERVKKFEDIFKEGKNQETIEYFYKRNASRLKTPNVLVYRKKVYLLLMKRRQVEGEMSKDEAIKDALELGAFIAAAGDGVREHLQYKKEYITNYAQNVVKVKMKNITKDPQKKEEFRLRQNAKTRQYYQRKKLGIENSLGEYIRAPYAPYGSKKREKLEKLETSDASTKRRGRKKKCETVVAESDAQSLTDADAEASSSAHASAEAACDSDYYQQSLNDVVQPLMPYLEAQIPINPAVASFYGINVNSGTSNSMMTNFSSTYPNPNYNQLQPQMPYLQSVDQYLHSATNQFYAMPTDPAHNSNTGQFSQFPSTSAQMSHYPSQMNLETSSNFRQCHQNLNSSSIAAIPPQEVEEGTANSENFSDQEDMSTPPSSPSLAPILKRKGRGRPKGSCNLKKRMKLTRNLEKSYYSVWDYYHPNYPNRQRKRRPFNVNMKLASEMTENPYDKIKEKIAQDLDLASKNAVAEITVSNQNSDENVVQNQNSEENVAPNQNSDENFVPKSDSTPNLNESSLTKKKSHTSDQKWSCKICGFEIGDYSTFLSHIDKIHYSPNNFSLFNCPYDCGTRQELLKLQTHIRTRHPQRFKDSWIMEISSWSVSQQAKHFICRHCPQESFNSFAALLEHYKIHSKLRYICDYCGICLRAEDHWQDHVKLFHPEKAQGAAAPIEIEKSCLHQCSGCESDFSTATFLTQHMEMKHRLLESERSSSKKEIRTVVRCDKCGIVHTHFFGQSKSHRESCDKYCFWCRDRLPSQEKLKLHLKSCHLNEPPVPKNRSSFVENYVHDRYKCEICRFSYLSLFRLRVHQMTHHKLYEFMQEQKKKGEIGVPIPPQNEQMKTATRTRVVTLEKPLRIRDKSQPAAEASSTAVVTCPMENCLLQISAQDVHQQHNKATKLMRRYCFPCARLFSRAHPFDCHNAVAHGIPLEEAGKPIVYDKSLCSVICPICPESFPPEIFHQQHDVFAKFVDPDQANCSLCGQEFINKYCLKTHLKGIHGISKNPETQNRDATNSNEGKKELKEEDVGGFIIVTKGKEGGEIFTCKLCMKNYKTRDFTASHIISAHKEDAFTRIFCEECNATFSTKNTLWKHVREHHTKDKTVFLCPFCTFHTLRMDRLRIHVKGLHPGETLGSQDVKTTSVNEINSEKGRHCCKLCSRAFLSSAGLESHMTSKHFPINCTAFCEHCGLHLKPYSIPRHIELKHPEKVDQRQPVVVVPKVAVAERKPRRKDGEIAKRPVFNRKRLGLAESVELIHEVFSCYKRRLNSNRAPRKQKERKVVKARESETESEEEGLESESEVEVDYDDTDTEPSSEEETENIQTRGRRKRQRSSSKSKLEDENSEMEKKPIRKSKRVGNSRQKVVFESESSEESDYLPSTPKEVASTKPKRNLRQSKKAKLQNESAGISQPINFTNLEDAKRLVIPLTRCDTLTQQMKAGRTLNKSGEGKEQSKSRSKTTKTISQPKKTRKGLSPKRQTEVQGKEADDEIVVKEEFEIYPDLDDSQSEAEEKEEKPSWQFIPLAQEEDEEEMEDESRLAQDPLAY